MGDYNDAVALGQLTHTTPNTALVRNYASRPGVALNFEQDAIDNLGVFARLSLNDGSKEAYEFTEINRSVALGLSLKGTEWSRPDDTIGFADEVADISHAARNYFAAGGLGILIGDGQLPHYGLENVMETYYSAKVASWFTATLDYQFIADPAYNRDRGPVSVFGVRLHGEF
jgi:high affinity Mn2+ porin